MYTSVIPCQYHRQCSVLIFTYTLLVSGQAGQLLQTAQKQCSFDNGKHWIESTFTWPFTHNFTSSYPFIHKYQNVHCIPQTCLSTTKILNLITQLVCSKLERRSYCPLLKIIYEAIMFHCYLQYSSLLKQWLLSSRTCAMRIGRAARRGTTESELRLWFSELKPVRVTTQNLIQ